MDFDYVGYIGRVLENLRYKKIRIHKPGNIRLIRKIRKKWGLEGKLACLFFDSNGDMIIYVPPKKDDS